jgi:transposase
MKKQGRPKTNEMTKRVQVIINDPKVDKLMEKENKKVGNRSKIINTRLLHSYSITPNFNDL